MWREIVKTAASPLLIEEGTDATSSECRRRHPLIEADGVVRNISDHPVCASKVASQLFLIAQPPLLQRRGLAAACRFFLLGNTPFSPRSFFRAARLRCSTACGIEHCAG